MKWFEKFWEWYILIESDMGELKSQEGLLLAKVSMLDHRLSWNDSSESFKETCTYQS